MATLRSRMANLPKLITVFVIAAVLIALGMTLLTAENKKTITVDFPRANSLYVGSDVKVLGVAVGKIESIEPRGDLVRVKLSYDAKHKLPADVKAAIISPSLVGDRFVQMAPAYSSGPVLKDAAYLNPERTEVPVELDEVYESLSDLSVALGPNGVNQNGALSDFLKSNAELLDGQGKKLNTTITSLSKFTETLSNNKEELFGSLQEVDDFVKLLERNDKNVRRFNDSTADIAEVLEGERKDLAKTLQILGVTLQDLRGFVTDNRKDLRANIDDLAELSTLLAKHEESLTELTVAGPVAYANLAFTYNPKFGTLDNRADIAHIVNSVIGNPIDLICGLLKTDTPVDQLCDLLKEHLGDKLNLGQLLDLMDSGGGSLPQIPGLDKIPGIGALPGLSGMAKPQPTTPQEDQKDNSGSPLTDNPLTDLLGGQ